MLIRTLNQEMQWAVFEPNNSSLQADLRHLRNRALLMLPDAEIEAIRKHIAGDDLSRLLLRNPNFRVLYCCGYYDLACPLNATHFTVNHMGLDAATRSHVNFAYYPAGHMMYIEKASRKKLHDDAASFVSTTLGKSQ